MRSATRIPLHRLAPMLFLMCSSGAVPQAISGSPQNLVHVVGRLVDSQNAPYSNTSIVFTSTAGPGYKKEQADTDQKGNFEIDLERHTGYDVWLRASEKSTVTIGRLSFGDIRTANLGDLLVESLPHDKFALHVPGRFRFKDFSEAGNLAKSPSQTVAAVYIDCPPAESAESAAEDCRGGRAHVYLPDGTSVTPPLEKDQVGASQSLVSSDNRAAGWLVDFDNCCTSYPLSLPLVIYRPGKPLLTFRGDARAIFDWHFIAGGRRFAMCQEFPHGNLMPHYELHDVDSGQLLGQWDDDDSNDEQNNQAPNTPAPKPPAWVDTFVANC